MEAQNKSDYHYHFFGLNFESSLPLLDLPEAGGKPDVIIKLGNVPDHIKNAKIKGNWYQAGPGEFILRVDNVASYYVCNGAEIMIAPEPETSDLEILIFLMGSAMGALLHQRNILPLHASAIDIGGSGIIFLGPSGIGKSTIAAGFHQKGYAVLSDDVCATRASNGNVPAIIPGFPRLKLWADTLEKIEQDKKKLQRVRVAESFDKYFSPFHKACMEPVPIKTVFLLNAADTDTFTISQLKGVKKIDLIMEQTYRPHFLEGMGDKQKYFKQCAAIAVHSKIFKIVRPENGFRLNELMDFAERHF